MTQSHGQLTRRISDSATVSVVEGEVIHRPLAQADGTKCSVRRPPRETLGGLPQAVIHPHCFGAGGMTVNNPFTVTGRIIPSYKKRPRRETRRSLPKANGGVVKHDSVKQDDAPEQGSTLTDNMIKFRRKKL